MSTGRFGRGALLLALALMWTAGGAAGDLEQEFEAQLERARGGEVGAMYAVGEMYELGMGTASSRNDALQWYRAAAERGHPGGAYQVGYAYYWGKGVKRDRREAHVWFLRAAEAGSQPAMPYLSKMYALGQGVPQDKAKAAEWAQRANTASNVHKPPPAPEVAPPPPPRIAKAAPPAPAPAEVTAPEPAPPAPATPPPARPQPVQAPKPRPQPEAKPAPKPKPKPKPKPRPKPKPKVPPAEELIARLLAWDWQKAGRPALYLPSSQTDCEADGEQLSCASEARRSSLLGRPYAFRLVAQIDGFDDQGGFKVHYRPEVTGVLQAPPGGYGEEGVEALTEQQLRERVERAPEDLNCVFDGEQRLNCEDARGQALTFDGVEPGPDTAAATPPPQAPKPEASPPAPVPLVQAQAQPDEADEQESARNSRPFGRRP